MSFSGAAFMLSSLSHPTPLLRSQVVSAGKPKEAVREDLHELASTSGAQVAIWEHRNGEIAGVEQCTRSTSSCVWRGPVLAFLHRIHMRCVRQRKESMASMTAERSCGAIEDEWPAIGTIKKDAKGSRLHNVQALEGVHNTSFWPCIIAQGRCAMRQQSSSS